MYTHQGFPLAVYTWWDLSPHMGGTSAGGQCVNGETHEGGHRPYGGPNFDRLYHKLKVLLMLSCNYMM